MGRRRVLRWVVPIDDRAHEIGGGPVVLVASRYPEAVSVWTVEETDEMLLPAAPKRKAIVVGTGHALPDFVGEPLGSTTAAMGLVWHCFEVVS